MRARGCLIVALIAVGCGAERKSAPAGYVYQRPVYWTPDAGAGGAGGGQIAHGPGHASLEALVPFQQWPQVPARVRGILYVAGPQPWGGAINHMRGIEASPDRREYKFGFDRSSPYAIYFESDGRGYNYLHGWQVPTPTGPMHINSAMFLQDTPNTWGLNRGAHIVEIDVNHGRGGVGGHVHFVATSLRVLDGTPAVPMRVEDVLLQLTARFQRDRGTRSQGIWPTWIDSEGVMEVLFYAPNVASMYRVTRDGRVVSETRYP